MARFRVSLLAALFLLSAAFLAALPGSGGAQAVNHLVISEVIYDPPQSGVDTSYEWIELFNPTSASVDLTGWALRDNNLSSKDLLPSSILAPGQYLVVAATAAGFAANYAGFAGNLVTLSDGSIGNGLLNTGDRVILLDPSDNKVDSISYGSDTNELNPACRTVSAGQSLARVPAAQDTDAAADWVAQASPNPGEAGTPPTSTPSATNTAMPSPSATASPTGT